MLLRRFAVRHLHVSLRLNAKKRTDHCAHVIRVVLEISYSFKIALQTLSSPILLIIL